MSASKRTLKPSFGNQEARQADREDYDLHKPRFVFSPFARITSGLEDTGLESIEPGVITLVKDHKFPIRNIKKIEDNDEEAAEFARHTRAAGHIVAQLVRNHGREGNNNTGFLELTELMGCDPDVNPQDAMMLVDMQEILLPELFDNGFEQLEFLESRKKAAGQKGELYRETLKRMIEATETAINFNQMRAADLRDGMAQRAKGGEDGHGYRNKLFDPDRAVFEWIGEEAPQIQSPFAKGQGGQVIVRQPEAAPAAPAPDDQCENCGTWYYLIAKTGLPPKICQGCGESLRPEEMEPPAKGDKPVKK